MSIDSSAPRTAELDWFKSSYSSGEGGACIEVATATRTVQVRDSKDRQGPQLAFTPTEWSAFVVYAAALPDVSPSPV